MAMIQLIWRSDALLDHDGNILVEQQWNCGSVPSCSAKLSLNGYPKRVIIRRSESVVVASSSAECDRGIFLSTSLFQQLHHHQSTPSADIAQSSNFTEP